MQRTVEIQWNIKPDDDVIDQPSDNQNNTNQSTNDGAKGSDNTMLYLGIAGGIAVIVLVIIIVIRVRNSDLDDWTEDDLEFDDLPPKERISKPLPVGAALDDFEDKTIEDETPDRPDFIADFDSEVSEYEEEYEEEESEEEYEEEYEEEDSGITVDEHGTEWYEDEVGVWWFREAGQEDWEEFQE